MSAHREAVHSTLVSEIEQSPLFLREAAQRVLTPVPSVRQHEFDALRARLLNAVADVVEDLQEGPAAEILAAPSDREALIRALVAAPATTLDVDQAEVRTLIEQARLRGILARDRLLQTEGGVVSPGKAAELLHATRQTVNNRRKAGTLIGLKLGNKGHVYPVWQFQITPPGTLPQLEAVLKALDGRDAWTQVAFMLNQNSRLDGRRPLDLLREDNADPVIEAALAYGEQGGT
jgi:hypothetical protein